MENRQVSTKMIILTGMFAAVLAVLSQIQIPMPSGVPVTLQTFAVALTGFVLGWKYGLASTAVYILLGLVGVPVFTGFAGGLGKIVGPTGGFIWGFLFLAAGCGIARQKINPLLRVLLPSGGLLLCHLLGTLQYTVVADQGFLEALMLVSVPYLLKDFISVALAFVAAKALLRSLRAANIPGLI